MKSSIKMLCFFLAVALLIGCSSSHTHRKRNPFAGIGSPIYPGNGPLPRGGGRYVIGKPYDVAGEKYYPREDPRYDHIGVASWYGKQFDRRMTANGEWFDMGYITAAHPTLPLPSYAKVTNLKNGRSLVVRINDRGPFVANREIDLSKKSAELLGYGGKGLTRVRVQYLGAAPLNDKGKHLTAMNAALQRGTPPHLMLAAANQMLERGAPLTQVAMLEQPVPSRVSAAPQSHRQRVHPSAQRLEVAQKEDTEDPLAAYAMKFTGNSSSDSVDPVAPASFHASTPHHWHVQQASVTQNLPFAVVGQSRSTPGAGYFVQVGAFSSAENVSRVKESLSLMGPVVVSQTGENALYRVQIGPLENVNQAERVREKVVARGHLDAHVVLASN